MKTWDDRIVMISIVMEPRTEVRVKIYKSLLFHHGTYMGRDRIYTIEFKYNFIRVINVGINGKHSEKLIS